MTKQWFQLVLITCLAASLAACASNPADGMRKAADAFLNSLDARQKAQAYGKFSHKNRNDWVFLPDKYVKPEKKRFGLVMKEMSEEQQKLALGLLHSALSAKGQITASKVRLLEDILFKLTKDPIRDSKLYYVSIFGTPSDHHTWGWTFEGHHLSINVTLVEGKHLSLTPSFFASNPGVVKEGEHKGLQVLAGEENIARELAKSLSKEQFAKANVFKKAPKDIFSADLTKIERAQFDIKNGLPYKEMNEAQKAKTAELIKVYIEKFRPELLKSLDSTPLTELDSLVFVWVGELEMGKPHYYRLVTTNHLIEYDNVQNGAYHPHTVWREFDGDFGEDLLKKHHDSDHTH